MRGHEGQVGNVSDPEGKCAARTADIKIPILADFTIS